MTKCSSKVAVSGSTSSALDSMKCMIDQCVRV